MTLIVIGVSIFGADITEGASQVALLLAALTVIGISLFHLKMPWSRLEEGIIDNLGKTGPAGWRRASSTTSARPDRPSSSS